MIKIKCDLPFILLLIMIGYMGIEYITKENVICIIYFKRGDIMVNVEVNTVNSEVHCAI